MIDCTAACAAPALSCSPVRRATTAVVPMLKPRATAKTITSMPSVMPTVAVASAPRWATKKISTMPKSDSIAISSTMGTASSTMARSMEMAVKSCLEPRKASLSSANQRAGREGTGVAIVELKQISMELPENRQQKTIGNGVVRAAGIRRRLERKRWLVGEAHRRRAFCNTDAAAKAKKVLRMPQVASASPLLYNPARGVPPMKIFFAVLLLSAAALAQNSEEGKVVRYELKPSELKYTYAASYNPVAHLKPGNILETNTVDCFGNAIKKPGDTLSMALGDNPLTGPFYIDGAEPGDTLA